MATQAVDAGGLIDEATDGIGRGMARGAAWMVLMRLVVRGASIVNMVILARLLVPEDFGLIAMAMIVISAIDVFSEFNFDIVLIRQRTTSRVDYDTAWTLSIIRGVVAAGVLLALAAPAADLFDEARLQPVIAALAVSPLIAGFENIGLVDFRKALKFRQDFLFMAGAKIVSVVIAVALALIWRNYWALVGGMIGGSLWRVAASFAMHPYRPRLSLAHWRELFAFTKWLLLHNILLFFRNRADRLVIGKLLGAATLGVYSLAFDLSNMVTSELMAPVRRALYPGYARLAAEPARMRAMFVDVFALTLWIGAPLPIGIGLLADPLIHLLLGDGWAGAVPITQLLVIAGLFALLSSGSQPVFLALGRPELQTYLMALSVVLLLPAIVVGVLAKGVLGAALALVLVRTLVALIDIIVVMSLLKVAVRDIAAICWRSVVSLGLMSVAVHEIMRTWPRHGGAADDALLLVMSVVAAGTVYFGCSFLLWRLSGSGEGPERHIWTGLSAAAASLRVRAA
ncbi:MAG: lipopolysaccharide biosynthesis protein [Alphaproteobacteria bacterium]